MQLITNNLQRLFALCKKYKVRTLDVFGSILTQKFNENSDIDFLVRFKDEEIPDMFDHFFDFIYELENLFQRKIDLVDESAVTNPRFKDVLEKTKFRIYG